MNKCIICKKRRAKSDAWKTPHEKETCFTCFTVESSMYGVLHVFNDLAKKRKVPISLLIAYNEDLPIISKKQ